MGRIPSHALLGPALLLYLVADGASSAGELDAVGVFVALASALLALTPLWVSRSAEPAVAVGVLGLSLACGLLWAVTPGALSLGMEFVVPCARAVAALVMLELSFRVPDGILSPARTRVLRGIGRALCAASITLAALGLIPALPVFGSVLVVPSTLVQAPTVLLVASALAALALRVARGSLGSAPRALAANAWAMTGLWVAIACAGGALLVASVWPTPEARLSARAGQALGAAAVVLGHVLMVEPRWSSRSARALRGLWAGALAVGLLAGGLGVLWPFVPDAPHARFVAFVLVLVAALSLRGPLSRFALHALGPASGSLLTAFEHAQAELARCRDLQEVARVALGAARRAGQLPDTEPVLYLLDPELELRLDAAGQPHTGATLPPGELLAAVRARPHEIVLRGPLEDQLVRMPSLRGLHDALAALDALCVVPLTEEQEPIGLLVVPRGRRTHRITLEEYDTLQAFGRRLCGLLSVLGADARAQRRADAAFTHSRALRGELDSLRVEHDVLLREVARLRDQAREHARATIVAYGPAMRALLAQLTRAAHEDAAVLLWAERGVSLDALARHLHDHSPRAAGPLLSVDCATLPIGRAAIELAGEGAAAPGLLARAANGTLVLHHLAALGSDAQQVLTAALATRRVHVVATTRSAPDELCERGVLRRELRAHFRTSLRVPPLRERPEDLPSLCLLALDAATRILGREPIGLEPAATERLLAHTWPDNQDELDLVIERAVAHASGPRVIVADLPTLGATRKDAAHPLDTTLELVERRTLRRALERTAGNRSEAARLLDVPRTTLIDKLRRHGLDTDAKARASDRPPGATTPDDGGSMPPN